MKRQKDEKYFLTGQTQPLFVYFCSFLTTLGQIQHKIDYKLYKMVCLGVEPRSAGWKSKMNPLSYGGTQEKELFVSQYSVAVSVTKLGDF